MPIQKVKRIFPLGHTWDLVLARLSLGLRLTLVRLENLMFHYSMDIARLKKENHQINEIDFFQKQFSFGSDFT